MQGGRTLGVLEIHILSDSFKAMAWLLNEQELNWGLKIRNSGENAVSSGVLEVAVTSQVTTSVAVVLKRFVAGRNTPNLMLTTKLGNTKCVEHISNAELEDLLGMTDWLAAIQTSS